MRGYLAATIVCCVFSYLVCGIPFGMIIAKDEAGVDVRHAGSGNIGMTNVARTVGARAAGLTLLCDAGKGLLCMLVFRLLLSQLFLGGGLEATAVQGSYGWSSALLYMSCVFGHVYSPYLHFHGGKGISVGFGAALGLWWPIALGLLVVFLLFALPSRYVSLGSVAADISLTVQALVWRLPAGVVLPLFLVTLAVGWAHRGNIAKLARGEERKFAFHHEANGTSDPKA